MADRQEDSTQEKRRGFEAPKVHTLKCHPAPFDALKRGTKKFEFRRNDRDFFAGHVLLLREWDPDFGYMGGHELHVRVTYVARGPDYGIPDGFCVMSVEPVEASSASDADENSSEAPIASVVADIRDHCAWYQMQDDPRPELLNAMDKWMDQLWCSRASKGALERWHENLIDNAHIANRLRDIRRSAETIMGATLTPPSPGESELLKAFELVAEHLDNESVESSSPHVDPSVLAKMLQLISYIRNCVSEDATDVNDALTKMVTLVVDGIPRSKEPSQDARLREAVRIIRTLEWRKGYCLTCQHMEPGKHSADCPVGLFLGTNTEPSQDKGSSE